MRFGLALLLVSSVAAADPVAAIKQRDAKKIAATLATPLTYEGVWFPDATCVKRFGKGGVLKTKDRDAFARCVAGYKLQLSTRESASEAGVVLAVEPGVEIELVLRDGQIRWIGSAGGERDDAGLPMLTAQAFEALRTKGTTMLDDAVRGEIEAGSAWIKTCLDERGAASRSVVRATTQAIGNAFLRATADWAFKPFRLRRAPAKACSLSLLTYPAAKAPTTETLPDGLGPRTYAQDDITGETTLLLSRKWNPPPAPRSGPISISQDQLVSLALAPLVPAPATKAQMARTGVRHQVLVRVCIDEKGAITSARTIVSHAPGGEDRLRLAQIQRWRLSPHHEAGVPAAACAPVAFVWTPSP